MSSLSNSFQEIFNYERCISNVHTQKIFVEGQKKINGNPTLLLYVTENNTNEIKQCIESHRTQLLENHQCVQMITSYTKHYTFYKTNKKAVKV